MISIKRLHSVAPFVSPIDALPTNLDGQRCAIVGSSSTLLGSNLGATIDGYDVIIRCNQAIVQGFEDDVGSKISARIVNGHSFCATDKKWPSRQSIVEKHPTFDPDFLNKVSGETIIGKDYQTVVMKTPMLLEKLRQNNKVLLVHPTFKRLCYTFVSKDPTCGFVAAMIGLWLYSDVSCFGFKMGPDGYHHYYERIKQYDQSCHSFNKEVEVLKWLHDRSKLKLIGF